MAVLTHEVHEKVRIEHNKPYGCNGFDKRSHGYWVQERSYRRDGTYVLRDKFMEYRMSHECRYDMSLSDPRCENCENRGSGEAYSEMVRAQGT